MKMLGMLEVTTNNRITLPKKLVDALKASSGDFLLFYEKEDGTIVVKREKGK